MNHQNLNRNNDNSVLIRQRDYLEQQNFVSSFFIIIKLCIFLLSIVSLLKIGYVSKFRITRLKEIKNSYSHEKLKYQSLAGDFDNLFSFQGEQRFMKDQDQIISKNIIRVIWQ